MQPDHLNENGPGNPDPLAAIVGAMAITPPGLAPYSKAHAS